jgi:predicted Fe-Mo cluster-binding NifX family protein
MKVCFAVQKDDGVESVVYGHFGSAPAFIVVDTDIDKAVTVNNRDLNHVHGACNPIQAIGGLKPDAVVVGGIGAGAITRLNAEGVKVYRAAAETVQQNLDLLKESKLPELSVQNACAGHTQGQGGCGH